MAIKLITLGHVEHVSHDLAKKMLEWNEPIPDFSTRYPDRLESCVAAPFQTYGRKPLYAGLVEKAAILFYLMTKNHPFQNGNKRVAVTTMLVFLTLNGKWLAVDVQELYNFAIWVAESPASVKDETVLATAKFIGKNLKDA